MVEFAPGLGVTAQMGSVRAGTVSVQAYPTANRVCRRVPQPSALASCRVPSFSNESKARVHFFETENHFGGLYPGQFYWRYLEGDLDDGIT